MSRLGDLIQLERTRRGLTPKAVAKLCAISEKYLFEVEQGKRIINDSEARRILKRMGLEHQTEADFSLDDIAATVDLHTAAPSMPTPAASDRPRPVASLPAEEDGAGIWLSALSSVLREVPVKNAAWQIVDHRTLATKDGKIEGGSSEKALFFLQPDESLRGFRIAQGDIMLIVPCESPVDGALMLVRRAGHHSVRKVQKSGERLMLLSYDRSLEAEPVSVNDVVWLGRAVRAEITL